MFSIESPHRGDSNKHIKHKIINIKKILKIVQITKMSAAIGVFFFFFFFFFLATRKRVRNGRGKRAISARATEVFQYNPRSQMHHFLYFKLQYCPVLFTVKGRRPAARFSP